MRAGRILLPIAVSLLAATSAQAGWQDQISRYDANRLSKLEEAKSRALS